MLKYQLVKDWLKSPSSNVILQEVCKDWLRFYYFLPEELHNILLFEPDNKQEIARQLRLWADRLEHTP